MREKGMTGAPGLARGKRRGQKGSRPTASRIQNRSGGNGRLLRVVTIYLAFASVLIGSAYLTTRTVIDERERHQTEVELRHAQEKRQGRVVHALKDGHCRMARFDNASGRMQGNVTLPCDTPLKDPLIAVRDFNWGGGR